MSSGKSRRSWLEPETVVDTVEAEGPDGLASFMAEVDAAGVKRARRPGRPKGAINRKTAELEELWRKAGFADPVMVLGAIASADPVSLQAWFIEHDASLAHLPDDERARHAPSLKAIIELQASAADRAAPYLRGKMPIRVQVEDERLPTILVDLGSDRLSIMREAIASGVLSIGATVEGETVENQGLGAGDRHGAGLTPQNETSHDGEK